MTDIIMSIEEAKAERTQLEMVIDRIVAAYNKKTGAQVTAINISYSYSSLAKENLPSIDIEVKI